MQSPESDGVAPDPVTAFFRRHRTSLFTLVFTDMLDSTARFRQLGDQAGASFMQRRCQIARELLRNFPEAEEIGTAGDSFLFVFPKPSDGVRYALLLQARFRSFSAEAGLELRERMGLHLGEVVIGEQSGESPARDLYGVQLSICSRVMSLGRAGQILMTRGVFDSARQVLKGEELPGVGSLRWVSHGPYQFKGIDDPVDVCEVGEAALRDFHPPEFSDKARRQAVPGDEAVLGWRPAVGQEVPGTQWIIEEKLGEGAVGEVWRARHARLKEDRVFKFCFHADRVRSLKREVTLFRLLRERVGDHPNVVRLHNVYLDQPPFYLEEDFVPGRDLRSWCAGRGGVESVPLPVRLEIVAQTADGLQAAHDAGIIHRDVKPGNILVSPGRASPEEPGAAGLVVKLSDFGIGQVVSEEALAGVTRTGFTQTLAGSGSSGMGTTLYLAPEVVAGGAATTRSDIYSLGVVMYQLVVGDLRRPLASDWARDVADPLLREDLERCVAGRPEERLAGAADLARRLRSYEARREERRRALEQQAELDRAAARLERRRQVAVASVLVAAVALALAASTWLGLLRTRREQRRGEVLAYAANVQAAYLHHRAGDLGRAKELLRLARPEPGRRDLRDWEWHYLWNACRGDQTQVIPGWGGEVMALAWLSDERMVTATLEGLIRIWNPAQKTTVLEATPFARERWSISDLAVSPDGSLLATATWGTGLTFLDSQLKVVAAMTNPGPVSNVAFSPDGAWLAASGGSGLHLWDVRQRKWQRRLGEAAESNLGGSVFSPDSRSLWSSLSDGRVGQFEVPSGVLLKAWGAPVRGRYFKHAVTPDGRTLAVGGRDGQIRLLRFPSGEEAWRTNHSGLMRALAFSSDGTRLCSVGTEGILNVWEVDGFRLERTLRGHERLVAAIGFHPRRPVLATGGKDETVRLWEVERDPTHRDQALSLRPGETIRVSQHGDAFAALESGGRVTVGIFGAPQVRKSVPLPAGAQVQALSADGRILAVSHPDGRWELLDREGRVPPRPLLAGDGGLAAGEFSPDGRWFGAWVTRGALGLFETSSGKMTASWPVAALEPGGRAYLSFSADGTRLAVAQRDWYRITVVHLPPRPRVEAEWKAETGDLRSVALFPNGDYLVTTDREETVKIWEVSTQRLIHRLPGGNGGFSSAWISPNGRRVLAITHERLEMWETEHYRNVASIPVPGGVIVARLDHRGIILLEGRDNEWRFRRAPLPTEIESP